MILYWHLLRLWVLITLAALLAGVLLGPATVIADDELNHAGLVIRDAEGRITYAWVPFSEEQISGIELLRRSGIPIVTVGFGALGEGVCSIGGQGCSVAECRRNVCQVSSANAPYWQYFKQEPGDSTGWEWLPLGASSTNVEDGDVFGWSWTAHDPLLPALPAVEIASLAGAAQGSERTPAFRTIIPDGVVAERHVPPDTRTTTVATAILVVIGASAAGFAVKSRTVNST